MGEQKARPRNFLQANSSTDAFSEPASLSPTLPRDISSNTSPAPVRLFGFAFPPAAASSEPMPVHAASTQDKEEPRPPNRAPSGAEASCGARKFECHYCRSRFPTSQALGGHQNAHKRERQHAKRALLHYAATGHHFHHSHAASFFGDHHVYGCLHVASAARFDQCHPPQARYPSWAGLAGKPAAVRFYPGIWRMPVRAQVEQHLPPPALPLFGGKGVAREGQDSTSSSSSFSAATPKERTGFDLSNSYSLSLDLRL